jgi:hypothetical protein
LKSNFFVRVELPVLQTDGPRVGDPTVVNVSHALQNPEKTKTNLLNNPVPRNCDQIIAIYDFVTERSLVCIPVLFNGSEYKQSLQLRKGKEIKVAKNYFKMINNPDKNNVWHSSIHFKEFNSIYVFYLSREVYYIY